MRVRCFIGNDYEQSLDSLHNACKTCTHNELDSNSLKEVGLWNRKNPMERWQRF